MGRVPQPVAIVGVGFLGGAVADALAPGVIACSRTGARDRSSRVNTIALDVTRADLDASVLHAARSLVIAYAPAPGTDRRALYVDGTARLLDRITAPLARIVYIGSTSALPDHDGWVFEDHDEWPDDERGRVQRQAEAVVLDHGRARSIPTLVLRLGGLYGPGRELARIYRARDREPQPGHGWNPTNLIHRDDAVAAIVAALHAPGDREGIVHVVDDDHVPRRAMYDALARTAGVSAITWREPVPPDGVPRGKRVSNARMKQWLAIRLSVPTHRA